MATAETKFWTTTQNNSGGFFDHNPDAGVGYAICVEAVDANHAKSRVDEITRSYGASASCPCCGSRWSVWLDADDGEVEPHLYGEPLTGGWGIPSYIHYLDGRIEARGDGEAA